MAITYLDEPASPVSEKITYLDDPQKVEAPKFTVLTPDEEVDFRGKYQNISKRLGLNPDPDDPKHFYDYRGAYKAGKLEPGTDGHFTSEFKMEGHPRMVVDGVDTKTGKKAPQITYLPEKGERELPPDQTAENQNPENTVVSAPEVVSQMQAAGMVPKPAKKPAWLPRGDGSDLVGFVPFHGFTEAAHEGYRSAQGIGKEASEVGAELLLGRALGPKVAPLIEKPLDVVAGAAVGATAAAGTAFNPVTAGATKLEDAYYVARDYIQKRAAGTPITPQTLKEYEKKVATGFSAMFPEAKPEVTESVAKNFFSDLTSQALNEKFNTALLVLGGVEAAGGGKPLKMPTRKPSALPGQPAAIVEAPPVELPTKPVETPREVLTEKPVEPPVKPEDAKKEMQDGIANVFRSDGAKNAKEAKDQLVQQLELAEKAAPEKQEQPGHNKWVTVEVPGDGTFTVINTKENVGTLLKKAKRLATSDVPDKGYVEHGPTKADREWLKEQLESQGKEPAPGVITDAAQVQEIRNSIAEGQLTLRTGEFNGRKLSPEEMLQVRRQVENDLAKIGESKLAGKTTTMRPAPEAEITDVTPGGYGPPHKPSEIPVPEARSMEDVQLSARGQPKLLPEGTSKAPVPSRRAIIEDVAKALDIPVRFGRLFSGRGGVIKNAGGYFMSKPNIIASKLANDLITVSHEGGHKLDDTFNIWKNKALQKELDFLGDNKREDSFSSWTHSKPFKYKLKEGVAEFTRYWMMEPEKAQKIAPNTFKEFESILNSDPKLRAAFDKARDDIRVWRESDAQGRIRGSVSVGEPALKSNRPSERLINQFIDEYHTLSKVVDFAGKTRGKPLEPINDPYMLARLFKGMDGTVQSFLKNGTVDFRTRGITGEGLETIIKPIADSGKLGDFRDYMISRRARELHRRGKETGLRESDVNSTFEKLSKEHPEFSESFDKLQEWNDRLLQYAVDSKLLSPETKAVIQEMNRDYVPYNRIFEVGAGEAAVEGGGTGRGLNAGGNAFKGIKGSTRDIIDPLESMVKNTFHIISAADKNWINLALADLSKEPGMGRFVRRAAPKVIANKVALAELKDQLIKMGADFTALDEAKAKLAKQGHDVSNLESELLLTFFETSKQPSYGENIIKVNRAGKSEYYQLDPELYRSVKSLDRDEMNMLGRFMTGFANVKRSGVTLVPDFVISNATRDTIASAIQSKYNHVPFVQTIRGLFSLIGRPDLVNEWAVSGGKLGIENMYFDRTATQKALQSMLGKRLDGSPYTAADWAALTLKSPLELLRKMSAISELATRVGEYEIARNQLAKKGMLPENYRRLAAFESRNLLDFARSGAKMKAWNGMMPFFNAQVQGIVRMGEAFKKNPIGTTVKAFSWLTVPTAILYSINRNDPEYWDRPQWERDLFWLFPFGKDDAGKTRFLRIPKPFEWGAVFATLPERIFQWADKRDPKAFDELGQRIAGSFTPLPTGNPIFSILEVMAGEQGYSFWRGKKIVPESQKGLPPELQFDDRTSLTAKKLGRALKVSPKKIDYAIYGVGGGLANQTVHYGLDSILSLATGDETAELKPIPGRRFVTTPAGFESQAVEQFYQKLDKLKRERARLQAGEASEVAPEELGQLPAMERLSRGLSGLRKMGQQETDSKKKQEIQLQIRQLILPFIQQPEKEGLKMGVEGGNDSEK